MPGFITTALLHFKMNKMHNELGISKFIIDGFPRTFDNLTSFLKEFGLIVNTDNEKHSLKGENSIQDNNKIAKSKTNKPSS